LLADGGLLWLLASYWPLTCLAGDGRVLFTSDFLFVSRWPPFVGLLLLGGGYQWVVCGLLVLAGGLLLWGLAFFYWLGGFLSLNGLLLLFGGLHSITFGLLLLTGLLLWAMISFCGPLPFSLISQLASIYETWPPSVVYCGSLLLVAVGLLM
jgi:hypothetical protein